MLINRGLADAAAARVFLDPLADSLAPPGTLPQMERAAERLVAAVRDRRPIAVYGDYDADGVTAAAQLLRVLRRAGATAEVYIPDRQTEGYGLHPPAVRRLAGGGVRVLVAVDCGTTAVAAAAAAAEAGLELLVLDHHLPLGPLPEVAALVNPRVAGAATDYCAAGLAHQACREVLERLDLPEGDLELDLAALAALGTVADAVPLLGDNRILVARGLRALAAPSTPGLRALLEVAALAPPLRARDLSHALAPRLNAAGRLAHAALAVRLLVSDDHVECGELAGTLDRLNRERRALCDRVLADAVEEIERGRLADAPAIVLAGDGWHPGVVGIVASQLVERYYRPVVLIAVRDGLGRGSARSIPAVHLVEALSAAAGPLRTYGGHAMAAGLTLAAEAVPLFREAFLAAVAARVDPDDLVPEVAVDAEVGLEAVTPALAAELRRLAPFGQGNPEPVLLTRGLRATGTRLVGGGAHLRLTVSDGLRTAEAVGFGLGGQVELLAFTQARMDLAYSVEEDRWRADGTVQLVVEHLWTPDVDLAGLIPGARQVLERLFDRADDYLAESDGDIEQAPAFHTKVVGVTFDGRQTVLPQVESGEPLRLIRDPGNPKDPHAIKVCLRDGRQLGYLRAGLAARLAPAIDTGARYEATVTARTGGGGRTWGLNIYVERAGAPPAGDVELLIRPGSRAGAGLIDALTARVHRGRPLSTVQRRLLEALLVAEGRAAARLGPGSGLMVTSAMAAAALVASSDGPAAVVLPRAGEVDAWSRAAGAWLGESGVRTAALHGVLPARQVTAAFRALERGEVDVLFTSAAWVVSRTPAVASVITVIDWLTSQEDLARLQAAYGERIRLLVGPVPPGQLHAAARAVGVQVDPGDAMPRTALRLADRRGRPGHARMTAAPGGRLGKTLVVTAGARPAVAEARRLIAAQPELGGRLAYYHDGLPAVLRRVLEDLYGAGAITVVVAGSPLVDPALPTDVARVVAVGLPGTRLLAAEALGGSQGARGGAVVELAYSSDALAATAAEVQRRHPSRQVLVECYHYLRSIGRDGAWAWPGGRPPDGPRGLTADTVGAAVEIFTEAGLISRDVGDGGTVHYALIDPGGRVDLEQSLRYREGARERAAWVDLEAWATGPAATILSDLAGQGSASV